MSYPHIQARRHGAGQSSVNRIVIHGTVSPCVKGGARNVANYFRTTTRAASAHYVVDPGEIVQCVRELTIAYHAPPNTGSIGIELCDPQSGSGSRWGDANHTGMLRLAAGLVRDIARRHGIPIRRLSPADLRAGRKGICGHVDISHAFGMTDHIDPGSAFPWNHFLQLVTGSAGSEDDDMPKRVSLGTKKPLPIPPNEWVTIPWDEVFSDADDQHGGAGLSVLTGKADYNLGAGLTLVGLPAGAKALGRVVEVKPDSDQPDPVVSSGPIGDVTSDGGPTHLAPSSIADVVDKGNKVRVQVRHNSIGPATVEAGATCKVQYWR